MNIPVWIDQQTLDAFGQLRGISRQEKIPINQLINEAIREYVIGKYTGDALLAASRQLLRTPRGAGKPKDSQE